MGNNFVAVAAHSANADEKMMSLVLKHATVEQINAVNKENCSVFERAAFHNSPAVVRLLLDAKAEVNRAGGQPLLPMTVTKRGTIPEGMLQTLVEAGADIDAEGNNGNTALHLAAFRGLKGVVETLISLKADVNSVNVHELTPLVAALSKGNTDVAEVLRAAGGTAPGERSEQQLIEAASRGNEVAVDILLRAKVDIDAENDRGFTPLKSALNFGHLHIVEKLIAAGADTVMDRDSLIGVCRKRKINPAIIGLSDDSGKWLPDER
jgi:ankyrin repeat protein